ncbi:unnamed protein product, partial [Nesidiocoris tenuis]
MTSMFPDDDSRQLLLRKGVYPYTYISNWEVLEETSLPPRETFYSDLTLEHISEADFNHAHTVWRRFNIGTMMEYTLLYLKTDIVLLADVFESYR